MKKRKLTEKEDEDLRSDTRAHFPPAEPVDTDDNDVPNADASGDDDDESTDENQAARQWQE